MPLPRLNHDSRGGQQGCFTEYCQPARGGERVALAGAEPGVSEFAAAASSEFHIVELIKEMGTLRQELADVLASQQFVQDTVLAIKDGVDALMASSGPLPRDVCAAELCEVKLPHVEKLPSKVAAVVVLEETSDLPARRETDDSLVKVASKRTLTMPADNTAEESRTLEVMFKTSEHERRKAELHRKALENKRQYLINSFRNMTLYQFELILDSLMGCVILFNAIFIGIVMDYGELTWTWVSFDIIFSTIFVTEICIKLYIHNISGHFCGPSRFSNIFDATLVATDLGQLALVISAMPNAANASALPSASLFRVFRLLKLTRLLRLLRSEMFTDLLSMIQGMLGAMPTLAWSMVLFFLVIYIVALLFREFFGSTPREHVFDYFSNVPRSMLTTFRCAFGDCSSGGGVPIFEHIHIHYGAAASVFYCFFVFSITIGLFNVISAIFVESTMAAAQDMQQKKKEARQRDELLWSTSISALVNCIKDASDEAEALQGPMSQNASRLNALRVPNAVIDSVIESDIGRNSLLDLEICQADLPYLTDILDSDNCGSIQVNEFIDGIRRLRGDSRRSDIVCVDLMVRAIQKSMGKLLGSLERRPPPAPAQTRLRKGRRSSRGGPQPPR